MDLGANTITYYMQSEVFGGGWLTRGVEVDGSGSIHVLFLSYAQYGVLSKPSGSMVADWRLLSLSSGDLTTQSGVHWDGAHFWIVAAATQYNGLPSGNTVQSMFLTTTQRSCDCTSTTHSLDIFTLTATSEALASGLMLAPNFDTDLPLNLYTLTYTSATNANSWNDLGSTMTCNGGALEFVSGCLGDVMPLTGAANVVIDLAACLTFDGVALNSLANLALRASSAVTLTDLTNANADATAYSYITLITPTLTILPSLLLTAVPSYLMAVSYTVNDGSFSYQEVDSFNLEIPLADTVTFLAGCLDDVSEVYGDPDLSIDLSACVEFNGIPLTAPLQATSVITLTDLTNANANALAYPYFTLTAQTLNVDVDSYWFPVSLRTLQVSY